jgi:hypothetical protein
MTRAISRRPRRSAIRIVAELALVVYFTSFARSPPGTSSTDRYTRQSDDVEIRTVDV